MNQTHRSKRTGTLITALLLSIMPAMATLISMDDFESYNPNDALSGLNGGQGWNTPWNTGGTGQFDILNSGLSYSNGEITIAGGNQALQLAFTDAAIDLAVNRSIAPQTDTLYMSFLYQNSVDAGDATASADDFLQAGFFPTVGNPAMSVLDRSTTFQARTGTANSVDTTITSTAGNTYLLVLRMTNTTGGPAYDQASVSVNPSSLTEGLNTFTNAGTADVLDLSSSAVFNIRRAFQENGDTYVIDHLRIGTTFEDVVSAIPEPGTSGLMILGALLLGRRLRCLVSK